MNNHASPPAPSPSSNGQTATRAAAVAAGAGGSDISYRPRGVLQVISFKAGRALGKAAANKPGDDGNE